MQFIVTVRVGIVDERRDDRDRKNIEANIYYESRRGKPIGLSEVGQ